MRGSLAVNVPTEKKLKPLEMMKKDSTHESMQSSWALGIMGKKSNSILRCIFFPFGPKQVISVQQKILFMAIHLKVRLSVFDLDILCIALESLKPPGTVLETNH